MKDVRLVEVNNCAGCPPELGGCMGRGCPNYPHTEEVEVLICDICGEMVDYLGTTTYNGETVCACDRCIEGE
jgi:hypothetical protein